MNKITILLLTLLLIPSTLLSQDQEDVEIIEVTEHTVPEDLPFAIIEKVPIYPGCTGEDNAILKKCMSDHISKYVAENFNIKKASKGLPSGKHRVFVSFKIDKEGDVTNIRSRSVSKELEEEATRVIKKLPKLIPGQQKGKNVGVLYSLPITFYIEEEKEKKNE